MSLRIAALVKQIPAFEAMELGPDSRLVRDGLELEMNPYCRRAVAKAVELAQEHGGTVTLCTLGPPNAEDCLREGIAWGLDRNVETSGVLITDPEFAGSDTLATARALAAALVREGPFDLILTGRNSVDADTGQVGPELAELMGLPFATAVRHLSLAEGVLDLRCQHDDGWVQVRVALPALISTAERLTEPCKVDPPGRAAVDADRIRAVDAAALGAGPWGQAASPTSVGAVRVHEVARDRRVWRDTSLQEQVKNAVGLLALRGAFDSSHDHLATTGEVTPAVHVASRADDRVVLVVLEPGHDALARELLGTSSMFDAHVVAITVEKPDADVLGGWGADEIVELPGLVIEEDIASGVKELAREVHPWAIIAPGTAWGREIASRVAAGLSAGLTGDAIGFQVEDGRLVGLKPAFGGRLVAAIHATSDVQMATVRAGMLPMMTPREYRAPIRSLEVAQTSRVEVLARVRDDDLDVLAEASAVVGVGEAIDPSDYPRLQLLLDVLGAELGATRKVTDRGWLPRARQIGITGRSIAPRLFISIGASGKFNHMVGVRGALNVLAVNNDPNALVFDVADAGIVGEWQAVIPLLVEELSRRYPPTS